MRTLLSSLGSLRVGCNKLSTILKKGCLLSLSFFSIYIVKLEECLKDASCVGHTLTSIVKTLLLYVDDIVIFVRSPCDIGKQLRILQYFSYKMDIFGTINNTERAGAESILSHFKNFYFIRSQ